MHIQDTSALASPFRPSHIYGDTVTGNTADSAPKWHHLEVNKSQRGKGGI